VTSIDTTERIPLHRVQARSVRSAGRLSARAAEIAAIKATPLQEGVDEIRIPGERAYRDRARCTRKGIEIDRRIQDALSALAEERRRG